MPNVIGIRFKSCGKIYDFEINGIEVRKDDRVIIDSEFGLSIGDVAVAAHFVEKPAKELKKVLRLANEEDLQQKLDNEKLDFFELHEAADIEHSDMGWQAIARFSRELGMEDAVVEACRKNLLVWELYLNGIAAAGDKLDGQNA